MRKTKTIVIATAITTLLSATAVFADTTSSNTVQQAPMFSLTHLGEHLGEAHDWLKSRLDSIGFKSRLDSLVTSGTLTQAPRRRYSKCNHNSYRSRHSYS